MVIYNVTITLDQAIEKSWLQWMQEKHIQEVLDTAKFASARLTKVLSHQQPNQVSYSVQYLAESKEALQAYYKEDAPRLREEGLAKFGDKMLAFRTELEVVGDFYAVANN